MEMTMMNEEIISAYAYTSCSFSEQQMPFYSLPSLSRLLS